MWSTGKLAGKSFLENLFQKAAYYLPLWTNIAAVFFQNK